MHWATRTRVRRSCIAERARTRRRWRDRKSTRLNSSHGYISYAVFCLQKKQSLAPSLLSYNSFLSRHDLLVTALGLVALVPRLLLLPAVLLALDESMLVITLLPGLAPS